MIIFMELCDDCNKRADELIKSQEQTYSKEALSRLDTFELLGEMKKKIDSYCFGNKNTA